MRKTLFLFVILACNNLKTYSQIVGPLKIGDTIPDFAFQAFYDDYGCTPILKNLRGQVVILDFWNRGCLACISSMDKMDSLQKIFDGKLQIIYITKNNKKEVKELFSKIKIRKPDIPFVVDDTLFYDKLFPHIGDPLHVWIDSAGIIRAITSGYNATVEHIQTMIDEGKIDLSLRRELAGFNSQVSLLNEGTSRLNKYLRYHTIWFQGLSEETGKNFILQIRDSITGKPHKIRAVNVPAYTLFNFAYARKIFGVDINAINLPNNNRIFIESEYPELFRIPADPNVIDDWMYDNTFTYELCVPTERAEELLEFMKVDLQRYLPYKVSIAKRQLLCLVLMRTQTGDKLRTKNKDSIPFYNYNHGFIVRNATIQSTLFPALIYANQLLKTPIIDETGYKEPVDMDIFCQLNDLQSLKKELKKYGLSLELREREINVLIIKDK